MLFHDLDPNTQNEIREINNRGFGFLSEAECTRIAQIAPRWPLLVRTGRGRFTTSAQDVAHFVAIVDASSDYVRDVCFIAGTLPRPEVQR